MTQAPFDRFAICYAYYDFCINWHHGQFDMVCTRYMTRLRRIGFRPGSMGTPDEIRESETYRFVTARLLENHEKGS